jgi:hypothetical protein
MLFRPALASATEFFKLEYLKRSSDNTYTTRTHVIKTRYCYEYTYGEDALLKWVGPGEYSGNQLIFRSGTVCDVKAVYKKGRRSTGQCNSQTGNAALDTINNAQCRNMKAQIANQRHDRELDQIQARLDAQRGDLAAARAQLEAFKRQSEAQNAALRRQADASREKAAAYQRAAKYIRSENARIAKIKNSKKRAAARTRLQAEVKAIQAKLASLP